MSLEVVLRRTSGRLARRRNGRLAVFPALAVVTAALTGVRSLVAQVPSDTARLPDLVVTATRVPEARTSVPAATTVIRGDDLRARGVHFVLDALREVPGMTIVQNGSWGGVTSIFLRGGESDNVKVLLDGVPLNRPGGGINLSDLATDDLDRIEVVRGPVSVLYGADAMTGVIQLFTRDGHQRHATVTARGGSFGTRDVSAAIATGGPVALDLAGSRFHSNNSYAFNGEYLNTTGSGQLAWQASSRTRLELFSRLSGATAHFPTDGSGQLVDHNQFSTDRRWVNSANLSRELSTSATLHVSAYASRLGEGFQNRPDSPGDTSGFGYRDDRRAVSWRRGGEARIDWTGVSRSTISAGLGFEHETDHEHETSLSDFGFGLSADTTEFAASRDTRDAFVQALAAPVNRLSIQVGGRFDDNSAFGSFATWRAGLSWQLATATRIWAGAGTAFKAPTFSQLFAHSAFEVGNPALSPQRADNHEFGFETGTRSGLVRVGVTAFWERFRDLIQYVNASPGQPNYFNLAAAKSRGIEATASWTPIPTVEVSAQWTWLRTAVTDTGAVSSPSFVLGAPLIRRPARTGSISAVWRDRRWIVTGVVHWEGRRDDVDFSGGNGVRVILPGYATVDVALDLPVGSSPVDFTLRAENLFDAVFQQVIGFPGRGRTILVGARMRL